MSEEAEADYGHEEMLQAVLLHLLTAEAGDLADLCEVAGVRAVSDADGQPVHINTARTYQDAGILTLDRGVWIKLSDGSEFGFTISVGRRPSYHTF
jgi:hypothetical protein